MPKARSGVVHRLREGKGWSQEELARRAGIDAKTMSRLLKGEDCNISTVSLIAKALGTTPGRIIDDGTPDPPPSGSVGMSSDNRIHITFGISLPFELYNDKAKLTPILQAIASIANLRDDLQIDGIDNGSVKLSVSVSQDDYVRLMAAFEQHKFDSLKITDVTVPESSIRKLATGFAVTSIAFPILGPALLLYWVHRLRKAGIESAKQPNGTIRLTRVTRNKTDATVAETLRQIPDLARSLLELATPERGLPSFPFTVTLKLVPSEDAAESSTVLMKQLREHLLTNAAISGQVQFSGGGEHLEIAVAGADILNELIRVVVTNYIEKPVVITASIRKSEATPYAAFNYEASVTTRLDEENLEKVISDIESRASGTH